jgi:hypothetical protein
LAISRFKQDDHGGDVQGSAYRAPNSFLALIPHGPLQRLVTGFAAGRTVTGRTDAGFAIRFANKLSIVQTSSELAQLALRR